MVRVREARASDVVKVTRLALPQFAGIVVEEDGETIGTGLVLMIKGRPMVTFDMTERLRQMPMVIGRFGFALVNAGMKAFGELYVMQDQEEEGSARWLRRLGFQPTEELLAGEKVWKRLH